jgi:hypothetical protein
MRKYTTLFFVLGLGLMLPIGQSRASALFLEWEEHSEIDGFILEIAADENFKQVLIRQKTKLTKFPFPYSSPGTYFWRIRLAREEERGPWSEVRTIQVIKKEAAPVSSVAISPPAKKEPKANKKKHRLTFGLGVVSQSIEGVDNETEAKGGLDSKLGQQASLRWQQHWMERFQSRLHLNLTQISYIQPSNRELLEGDHLLGKIGAGASWSPARWTLSGDLFYGQELYLFPQDENTVRLDAPWLGSALMGLSYELWSEKAFRLSLKGGVKILAPTTVRGYSTAWGRGALAGISLARAITGLGELELTVEYEKLQKNSSPVNQEHSHFRALISTTF